MPKLAITVHVENIADAPVVNVLPLKLPPQLLVTLTMLCPELGVKVKVKVTAAKQVTIWGPLGSMLPLPVVLDTAVHSAETGGGPMPQPIQGSCAANGALTLNSNKNNPKASPPARENPSIKRMIRISPDFID